MNDKEGDNGAGEFWVKTPKVGEILKMNCIFFFQNSKVGEILKMNNLFFRFPFLKRGIPNQGKLVCFWTPLGEICSSVKFRNKTLFFETKKRNSKNKK